LLGQQAAAVIAMAVEGTALTAEEARFFAKQPLAGVTLFSRNIPHPQVGVVGLIESIQSYASSSYPLIIAVDQEGGRVSRFKGDGFPDDGPALQLLDGRRDPEALTEIFHYAASIGDALKRLGVNVNFAPVVDVITRDDNPAIGDRAFAKEPEAVIKRAGAFLNGLQSAGVLGCLKHFPGQGGSNADTHNGAATVIRNNFELEEIDLLPFRALAAKAPMVMVSHCIYPELDSKPASLSPTIIQKWLRTHIGFEGLIVSDDMTMGAIPDSDSDWAKANVEAIVAGVELLLVCRGLDRCRLACEALETEAKRSSAFAEKLSKAASKVTTFRKRLSYQS